MQELKEFRTNDQIFDKNNKVWDHIRKNEHTTGDQDDQFRDEEYIVEHYDCPKEGRSALCLYDFTAK